MSAEPVVECVYCLRPMRDAEGWQVTRPDDGVSEFLCPGCRELPQQSVAQATLARSALGESAPSNSSGAVLTEVDMGVQCECGHTLGEHDLLATRYCAATASAGLTRACACPSREVGPARSYDRR